MREAKLQRQTSDICDPPDPVCLVCWSCWVTLVRTVHWFKTWPSDWPEALCIRIWSLFNALGVQVLCCEGFWEWTWSWNAECPPKCLKIITLSGAYIFLMAFLSVQIFSQASSFMFSLMERKRRLKAVFTPPTCETHRTQTQTQTSAHANDFKWVTLTINFVSHRIIQLLLQTSTDPCCSA